MKGLNNKRVFVGMSGGVDSSVTAMLLKNQGYDVTGVYLKCYVQPDGSCMRDAMDAMAVADQLGIPFHIWDFRKEYEERVINYMVEGYRQGLTPNPDIECNREIKFGMFLEKALKWGADYVATGHYVRLVSDETSPFSQPASVREINSLLTRSSRPASSSQSGTRGHPDNFSTRSLISTSPLASGFGKGEFYLCTAKDENKDQSYFLWTLTQEQLKHCLFPIGDYLKPEVREMARKAGLPTAEKKDSQGICFLGKVTLDDFLKEYLPEKRGAVLSMTGEKLGEHSGAHFYTIGQREGIGNLKHQKGVTLHKPLYVVSKDVKANIVTVAEKGDQNLMRKEVLLTGVNFINSGFYFLIRPASRAELATGQARLSASSGSKKIEVLARVRYRQLLAEASIKYQTSDIKLEFKKPQRFVTPGQSAVFYIREYNSSLRSRLQKSFGGQAGRRPSTNSGLRMIGGGVIT